MKLYVLSKSEVKKTAVKTSFLSDIFDEIEFCGGETYDSSVVSQPVGKGGNIICERRIESFLKKNLLVSEDYILSIENYITLDCKEIAVCKLFHNNNIETVYSIEGRFPQFLLEKLDQDAKKFYENEELIGYDNTIGNTLKQFLAEDNISVRDDNWIGFYNDFDRIEQIHTAFDKFRFTPVKI